MKNLPPEYCPICAALQYAVEHPGPGQQAESRRDLRDHQLRHQYGFYNARCQICEDYLTKLAEWLEESDDEVLQLHHEYETHCQLAHQLSGPVQDLWPGAQLAGAPDRRADE